MPLDVGDDAGRENHKCGLGCKRNINSPAMGMEEPGNAFTLQSRIHFSRLDVTHFKLKSRGVVVDGGTDENPNFPLKSRSQSIVTSEWQESSARNQVSLSSSSFRDQTSPSPRAK